MSEAGHPSIEAERLRLPWMSPAFMHASLAGRLGEAEKLLGAKLPDWWPDDRLQRLLAMRLDQMTQQPESAEWLLRAMVLKETEAVAGYINFHGTPVEGRAELGYTVLDEHRRRGFASEAVLAMMRWAHDTHAIETFVVSISPQNAPSLGLAAKLGFQRTGTQIDPEDGEEWVFELRFPE